MHDQAKAHSDSCVFELAVKSTLTAEAPPICMCVKSLCGLKRVSDVVSHRDCQ